MDRYQYYLAALAAGCYKWKAWVITVFSVTHLSEQKPSVGPWDEKNYPFRLYAKDGTYAFLDPVTGEELVIEGSKIDEPLLYAQEAVPVMAGQVPTITKNGETSAGNLLFNYLCCIYPFGTKLPYVDGDYSLQKLEKKIVSLLAPEDVDEGEEDPTKLYPHELRKYYKGSGMLAGLGTLFVPTLTPYTMVPAPGYKELKEKLLKQYEGRLNDPEIIAKIGDALEQLDREHIARDPDAGFYISDKYFAVTRKKLFYMHGIERSLDGGEPTFIQNSLNEGWDIRKLPQMADSLRDGSFSRGQETALGGEKTKTIFRVMAGSIIAEDDCGSKLTESIHLTENNVSDFYGNTALVSGKEIQLDEQNTQGFIGKMVKIRSPIYCQTADNNYCRKCVGEFVRGKENALANLGAEVGSTLMSNFMAKMHGTALKTTKYRWQSLVS